MTSLSIIICCHNSAERLPPTLEHLARQDGADSLQWEVVLVDNASTDKTAEAAREAWNGPTELRVVEEPKAGLSYARQAGIRASRGDLLAFVDDDNRVCPGFVSAAADLMRSHPEVAVCGGPSQAVFERDAPDWFATTCSDYAVGAPFDCARDITWSRGFLWGAGIVFRKAGLEALSENGFVPLLTGRKGKALSAGEDSELCYALRLAGWKIWYDPRLAIQHYMPAARLQWNYLRRLHRGFGASTVGLEAYHKVFEYNPESAQSRRHFRWQTQVALTLLELARVRRAWAAFPRRDTEGNWTVLAVERHLGRLQELLRWRQRYDRAIHEVWAAPWRKVRSLPPTEN